MFQKLLFFACLQVICSYYLYNDKTNQVISYPSLNNLPDGFKIIRAPRTLRKAFIDRSNLVCHDSGFHCKEPFDRSSTYQFECEIDDQCPRSYKCCQQNCFTHKICSPGNIQNYGPLVNSFRLKPPAITREIYSNPLQPPRYDDVVSHNQKTGGQCEKWPIPCSSQYSYQFSNRYKCEVDAQCPKDYLCCQQDCFSHKICSKRISSDGYVEELIKGSKTSTLAEKSITSEPDIISTDEETETTINTELTTIETTTLDDEDSEETTTEINVVENGQEGEEREEGKDKENEEYSDEVKSTEEESTDDEEEDESEKSTEDPNAINPDYKDYYYNSE